MIDISQEFGSFLFKGDLDEPFVLTKADGDKVLTGIFGYQSPNPSVEDVSISDAKKLTLTLSMQTLQHQGITITIDDILSIRGRKYQPIVSPVDNLNGTLTIQLGEVL